jgi:hypothetical protein
LAGDGDCRIRTVSDMTVGGAVIYSSAVDAGATPDNPSKSGSLENAGLGAGANAVALRIRAEG